jgi:hypothetical protein
MRVPRVGLEPTTYGLKDITDVYNKDFDQFLRPCNLLSFIPLQCYHLNCQLSLQLVLVPNLHTFPHTRLTYGPIDP